MLAERHGWIFISGSDLIREGLRERGLPIERENLRALGNEWRKNFGPGVLIDKSLVMAKGKDLVIASIRSVGEAKKIHELGGKVVWVDADPQIRFKRITSRGRGAEDEKTYEQFLAEEEQEMINDRGGETELNMSGVKAIADIFIENNGNDIEAFKDQAEKNLKSIL